MSVQKSAEGNFSTYLDKQEKTTDGQQVSVATNVGEPGVGNTLTSLPTFQKRNAPEDTKGEIREKDSASTATKRQKVLDESSKIASKNAGNISSSAQRIEPNPVITDEGKRQNEVSSSLNANETDVKDGSTISILHTGKADTKESATGSLQKEKTETKEATTTNLVNPNPPKLIPPVNTKSEIVSDYVKLPHIPPPPSCSPISDNELKELEKYLQIGIGNDDGWRDDWIGNLAFADYDIINPDAKPGERRKNSLFRWAEKGERSLRILNNLLRFVINFGPKGTPAFARRILGHAKGRSAEDIEAAVRRVSYDPVVLRQDGWTTAKSMVPVGASGGPYRIGEKVYWQGYVGVVIAYIHDQDLGDLWKAMWLQEFETFDLEAEELDDARNKYERKAQKNAARSSQAKNKQQASVDTASARRSGRYSSLDFHVKGIEHGIVLATSYSRGSRPGVFWPARVMHFTEVDSQSKRSWQKQKVDVVFLAPYWNANSIASRGRRTESYSESLSRHGNSIFSSSPLFEYESVDASEDNIQEYSYTPDRGLDFDDLRTSFKFSGLPKAAFSRFVDSHRLALGLRTYSTNVLKSTAATDLDRTTAGLFEAHPLAAQTASFPDALLHLPFEHILSQLPSLDSSSDQEPALQFGAILDSMKPPNCWGFGQNTIDNVTSTPEKAIKSTSFGSPPVSFDFQHESNIVPVSIDLFISDLSSLTEFFNKDDEMSMRNLLAKNLHQLFKKVPSNSSEYHSLSNEVKRRRCKSLIKLWIIVKDHGEELISACEKGQSESSLADWCILCERIYRYITRAFSSEGFGEGVSWVVTDSICNQHLTSQDCFERAVRLPAALKAAKQAGAGKVDRLRFMASVKQRYLHMAENEVIRRAHSKTYLQRMKKRCMAVVQENEVVPLTEDSDGNGGEDTMGSRGSWQAAIAAVAAAIQSVDMIMGGECVNIFCATRPPGHHAGRELHPMKAVSNGFCLLNNAACAALYATSPVSEGGPGLRRVCIIDIDVHHGNGTQDILCSTYDPRFLYVSIHAGGADVNGLAPGDDAEQLSHHLGRTSKKGIFPGRCGDSSPHQGVLNIPLGGKVTSHALGTALVTKVTPAVKKFSPELIIVSTGFDAHKNDPLGLGGLGAEDFGTLTEVICKLANKSCSGRVLSILEGGYGVPCCRIQANLFDPEAAKARASEAAKAKASEVTEVRVSEAAEESSEVSKEAGEAAKQASETGKSEMAQESKALNNGGADSAADIVKPAGPPLKQLAILDLGDDLPASMKDEMDYDLQKLLDKCHAEGFIDCVREHVSTLARCNTRS